MADQDECKLCGGVGEIDAVLTDGGGLSCLSCPDCAAREYAALEAEVARLQLVNVRARNLLTRAYMYVQHRDWCRTHKNPKRCDCDYADMISEVEKAMED